jgi:ATP-dependent Clp protease ATP-binding subunit ClpC
MDDRETVFDKFTDRARRVVVLAQEEARMLNHSHIGTEHLLLGVIREGQGVGAMALEREGISLDTIRREVEGIIGHGEQSAGEQIPFTTRAKKVLELSLRESLQLGHDYIGTEHLLLGLIREGDGVAAQVLDRLGASEDDIRNQVIRLLADEGTAESAAGPRGTTPEQEASGESDARDAVIDLLREIIERLERIEQRLADDDR